MWFEDLFLWVRRDSIHLKKVEEGIIIAKRLQELAASQEAKQAKSITEQFPNPSTRRNR